MTLISYLSALLPETVLVCGACMVLFLSFFGPAGGRRGVGLFALVVIAAALGVVLAGQGQAPADLEDFGVRGGPLADYVRLLTLVVGAVLVLVNWYQAAPAERGEYASMLLLSMAGVMLVGMANDLILLFFAIELVSVPTYVLVALSRRDVRAQEACSKYFFLGAMAAALLAYGMSFIYGAAGTTTLTGSESIAAMVAGEAATGYLLVGMMLAFGALCFKVAAVPFHSYVADVYEGAAAPLAGALGFLPKLAGFAAMIKLMALTDWAMTPSLQWALWFIAALTMTVGNTLALMQSNVKRLLAYSGVAHSGYMMVGLLVGPQAGSGPFGNGVGAVLFYVSVYALMNLGAFAVISSLGDGETESADEESFKGLGQRRPLTAIVLAVCMFSLMGLPPTAGFLGKVYIFSSALSAGDGPFGVPLVWLAIIGVINSAVGAAYYLRVVGWCYCFPGGRDTRPQGRLMLRLGAVLCGGMMLLLFLRPQPLLERVQQATSDELVAGDVSPVARGD